MVRFSLEALVSSAVQQARSSRALFRFYCRNKIVSPGVHGRWCLHLLLVRPVDITATHLLPSPGLRSFETRLFPTRRRNRFLPPWFSRLLPRSANFRQLYRIDGGHWLRDHSRRLRSCRVRLVPVRSYIAREIKLFIGGISRSFRSCDVSKKTLVFSLTLELPKWWKWPICNFCLILYRRKTALNILNIRKYFKYLKFRKFKIFKIWNI